MKCRFCREKCIKKGKRNQRQMYYCRICKKHQRSHYRRKVLESYDSDMIIVLNNEGLGIRSISRVLAIPKSTVSKLLLKLSEKIMRPNFVEKGEEYEMDELRTFVGSKDEECWICYAINRRTKEVIDFTVGRRTKNNLRKIIQTILTLNPKRIFTDKLNSYPSLIPKKLHYTNYRGTNYIERYNLNLRTHLKRLNRKTICFSRSVPILTACLKIYFWVQWQNELIVKFK